MHPIIALWSHPRSMSTATERIMRERGDLDCVHEPFMYFYYVDQKKRDLPHFDVEDGHPTGYEDIRAMLLGRAARRPVFFKDMSYYVMPRIEDDPEFARRLTNCFLIRDPTASIVSYHKLHSDVTVEEIGLEAQWRHFEFLTERIGETPVVIEAESIRADPRRVIGEVWQRIGLSYVDGAFDWAGSKKPADWQHVSGWHDDVAPSNCIKKMSPEEQAERARIFAQRCADRPHLADYYRHHQPFYERLKQHALA